MKRFIVLLSLAMLATSCAIMAPQQQKEIVNFLDYRPYTDAGFFISPYNYTGKFEPIGQLDIVVYPEEVTDGIYTSKKEIATSDLLEKAVKHTLGKGANGIANLKISRIVHTTSTRYGSVSALSHYEVSGFLIRITDQ